MSESGHLHLGLNLADSWREVVGAWLERATRAALGSELPWVVLTPSRAYAQALKSRLLAEGRSVGGLYFWTPGELRDHLRRFAGPDSVVAVREHLHLLLSSAASGQEENQARAVARDPSRLLRTLDQLHAAGRTADDLHFPPAEQLAKTWSAAVHEAGWTTIQHLDWHLAHHPPRQAIDGLLMLGFDAAHWDLWPLLQAAVDSAREADVILTRPRSKAEDLDQAWVGTWEEKYGEAEPMDESAEPGPFLNLAQRMEHPEVELPAQEAPVRVLIGRHVREQAEAVVAQCVTWLQGGAVTRLGILLPGPGPLAREISVQLLELNIPHYDTFGHPAPPSPVLLRWRAWSALQRSFRLGPLRQLLDLVPDLARPDDFESAVQRAFTDVLVDDLEVLAARAQHFGRDDTRAAAQFLQQFQRLPNQAPLHALLDATRAAWGQLGWNDLLEQLERQAAAVRPLHHREVPASVYLDWLEAVAPGPAQLRDPEAAHPLALVHLLPYVQAEGLEWSHLILADLNEGCWPPPFEPSGYLADDQISALNRAALATGRQGEGHTVVQRDFSLMMGPNERRAVCRRQFYNLVESARGGLALTCALESEENSGRIQPASDFLSHLYFVAFGQPLTEAAMQARHAGTQQWLATRPARAAAASAPQPAPVEQARIAYDARRAPGRFGIYECAFDGPPPKTLELSCKKWQDAIRDPAGLWLAEFLGVAPAEDTAVRDCWPLTRGTWVHAWLARSLCAVAGRFEERTRGAAIAQGVRKAAARTRGSIAESFAGGGRAVPEWWLARWSHAEWMALQFARRLGELEDWTWAATEWKLPKPAEITCGERTLHLRGRVDLLLAQGACAGVPDVCWVADFKTGSDKELSLKTLPKKFAQGEGVQLALYALVLAAAGSRDVQVSLLTPESSLRPQISLADVQAQASIWRGLAELQDTGVFGLRGTLRAEFGIALELPLATLPVEPDTLEEKWALTHPDLRGPQEDDDDA